MGEGGGGGRILLVEDDKFMVRLYEARLSAEGFSVDVAMNGDQCLEMVLEKSPDFILLDLMLPLADGFTVLERLKSDERTSHIPVIVFSNRSNPEDVSRAMDMGAHDFLMKVSTPPEEVIRRIRKILEKKHAGPARLPDHYYLVIDWDAMDARQLAEDLGIPVEYRDGRCVTNVVLDAIPECSHDEPWIMGHFIVAGGKEE
jgi:DNA-binding response OmpR family regulator